MKLLHNYCMIQGLWLRVSGTKDYGMTELGFVRTGFGIVGRTPGIAQATEF